MGYSLSHMAYAGSSGYWDARYAGGYIYGIYPSETAIKTAKLLSTKNEPRIRLLEIGGGYGRNAIYLNLQAKADATVIDFSGTATRIGKDLANSLGADVKFVNGDAFEADKIFRNEVFGIIFHNFCIHLLKNGKRIELYSKLWNLLRPGGLIIGSYLSTNDDDCPNKGQNTPCDAKIAGATRHFFTKKEILSEISGFFKVHSITESSDPEKIIDVARNTAYFFVVGEKDERIRKT